MNKKLVIGAIVMIFSLILTYAVPFGDGFIRITIYEGHAICSTLGGLLEAFGSADACGAVSASYVILSIISAIGVLLIIWSFRQKKQEGR